MKIILLLVTLSVTSCMPFNNPFSVEDYENGEGYYKYQNQTRQQYRGPGSNPVW